MKFPIRQIKSQSPFPFEGDVEVKELQDMNNDIRRIPPVHVEGEFHSRGDHIIANFTIDGNMILPCARTLKDVDYSFEIKAEEHFSTSPYEEDEEIHQVVGEVLDLTPYIKENIILEIPLQVYANDVLNGDMPKEQGKGWEFVEDQKEKSQKVDPRLAKLEQFFDEKKDS
ncbi:YceD family protein [Salirhabdus salicampi]|uniref:YceD family protein n=1 Tax=Salirhabdus salicampi TaxID=476102 RepID=UPI0020C519C2|nr:YceD family protein [Salirhabdus salicampi]MCP8616620.1 YceD family protein [Salirhabdus salicampi]